MWLVGFVILFSGCTHADNHLVSGQVEAPDKSDALMLVYLRQFSFTPGVDDIEDEGRIVRCVGDAIHRKQPDRKMVSFEEFRRIAFPHLDAFSAPHEPEYISPLFRNPDFQTRVAPLGVRYIAFLGGVTETGAAKGGITCVYGGPAGACFGGWSWDKTSNVGAAVLDVSNLETVGDVNASASGTAWFAIVGVLPLGLPANTESAACNDLGARIAASLGTKHNQSGAISSKFGGRS